MYSPERQNYPPSVRMIRATQLVPEQYTEYVPVTKTRLKPVTSIRVQPTPSIRTLAPRIVRNNLPPQIRTVTLQPKIVRTYLPPIRPKDDDYVGNLNNSTDLTPLYGGNDLLGNPIFSTNTQPYQVGRSLSVNSRIY